MRSNGQGKEKDKEGCLSVHEYDQELAAKNIKLAEANKEPIQPLVYVRVGRLRPSRIEGLTLQVA